VDGAVPYTLLHGTTPDYDQLRVFGCLCYPNLSATASHKLAPRSTACVFLGYPSSHKGYRCLDLVTKRIIISRHVVFDETSFPFSAVSSSTSDLDFLSAPNPAATRVAAPSLRDVERPRPSPLIHEDDDPAILVRGPLLQALPPAQVTASPPPAPAPVPPAPLPADPRAIIRVYSRRPRPPPAQQAAVPPADLAPPVQQATVQVVAPPVDPASPPSSTASSSPPASPGPAPPPPVPSRPVTRTQSGAIAPVRYVGLTAVASV
jgi:hypothetical protein